VTDLATVIKRYEEVHGVQGSIVKYTVTPSAKTLLQSIKKRIFSEGKNSNGQPIGDYSTKPIYVSRKQFANPAAFQPYGKIRRGRIVSRKGRLFAEEKKHKTMYLPNGYKQLRQIQGKESQFVNLNYRGKTMRAYVMNETNTEVLLGLNTPLAAAIRSKQEERFKASIFAATPEEIQVYQMSVTTRLNRIIRGITIEGQTLQSVIETPVNALVDDGVY
jgi:hypothetical protein